MILYLVLLEAHGITLTRIGIAVAVVTVLMLPAFLFALTRMVCDNYVRHWFQGDKKAFVEWYRSAPEHARQRILKGLPPE